MGSEGERKRRVIYSTTNTEERTSKWLWLKRGELQWGHKVGFDLPHLEEGV